MAVPDGLLVARARLPDLVEERESHTGQSVAESTTDTAPYVWLMSLSFPQSVLAGATAASTNGVETISPNSPSPSRPYAKAVSTHVVRCAVPLPVVTRSPRNTELFQSGH